MNDILFASSQIVVFGSIFALLFVKQIRPMIMLLWIAGVFAGVSFLTIGAEYLAIVTWIVISLSMISFQVTTAILKNEEKKGVRPIVDYVTGGVLLLLAVTGLVSSNEIEFLNTVEVLTGSLVDLGRVISIKYPFVFFISFLLLALVPVGIGLVTREEYEK